MVAVASPQWHVIIASREHAKSIEAVRSIISETGNSDVAAVDLNLGSLDSGRRFETDFAARALPQIGTILQCGKFKSSAESPTSSTSIVMARSVSGRTQRRSERRKLNERRRRNKSLEDVVDQKIV
jgi:hypothetical protein